MHRFEQLGGPPFDPNLAMAIAASLERHAVHPIAEALTALAAIKKFKLLPVENFRSIAGYGLMELLLPIPPSSANANSFRKNLNDPFPPADQMATYL